MRRLALPVLLALTLLVPAACGRNEVDEATLPTPVPTYTTEASGAAAAAAPTEAATDTETASAAETPADAEAVAESDAASQDQAAGAAAESTPEPAATEAAAATATPGPTATPAPTEAAEPTAMVAPTATPEPTTAPAPTATPEPTAAPATAADSGASDSSGADSEFAGVPEGVAALIPSADVARGEQLTLQNACIGCHNLNPDLPMAGPTWHNVAETAATRVEGESAPAYLYNSIVHPNDYVVEGYAPGVMIQTYGDTLSDQDLADIIGYLLTLKGE